MKPKRDGDGERPQSIAEVLRSSRNAWTATQICELMSYSTSFFYKCVGQGRIEPLPGDGPKRFCPREVERWILGDTVK